MSQTIAIRADRESVKDFVRSIPGRITGRLDDPEGIGEGFRARLGFALLSEVHDRFEQLSQGGIDEQGNSWPPNTPEYLAYGKGPKSSRMGSGRVNRWPDKAGSGELNAAQRKEWGRIFATNLAWLSTRHDIGTAKQIAAATAWKEMKARGAGTLLKRFGDRPDQILVDRGTLRRSLQAGEVIETFGGAATYRTASDQQIYEEATGEVVVGTSAKHAASHHEGKGHLPERRLWPKAMPASWWDSIFDACLSGLERIGELLKRGDFR